MVCGVCCDAWWRRQSWWGNVRVGELVLVLCQSCSVVLFEQQKRAARQLCVHKAVFEICCSKFCLSCRCHIVAGSMQRVVAIAVALNASLLTVVRLWDCSFGQCQEPWLLQLERWVLQGGWLPLW